MKKFYFVSGLPRSGSTLLMNILGQNPRFAVTATSGVVDIMFGVRNAWDTLPEFRAHPDEAAKKRVLRAILEAYFAGTDKPVAFDKSRGWLSLIEMVEWALEQPVKMIVPVRNIADVLASFEKLHRETAKSSQTPGEAQNYFRFQSVQGRCEFWMQADQPIGIAFNRIVDALQRGHSAKMLLVPFERLTADPSQALGDIYRFLGEEPFAHDFEHVRQITWEDDAAHGYKGLHDIRPKVEAFPSQADAILGGAAQKYRGMDFWRSM